MTTKRKRAAPRRPTAAQVGARLAHTYFILTVITIEEGNQIQEPKKLVAPPRSPIVWIIYNNDSVAHDVEIDLKKFTNKDTGKNQHPFPKDTVLKPIDGRIDSKNAGIIVTEKIKQSKSDLHFKYAIKSLTPHGTSSELDPDLDVVDPGSVI